MTAFAPSMITVFWWVYRYLGEDQVTLTECGRLLLYPHREK